MFTALPRQYQRHALAVYGRVREGGYYDLAVMQAALLHDFGKFDPASGRYVTVLHRVAVVLIAAAPGGKHLLRILSQSEHSWGLSGWILYPFYLSKHHARLGAEIAARYGASTEVVSLIRRHQHDAGTDARLLALQAADAKE
jgi:putative nucleotidyltransferase with HDIG domain